jgi:predicted GIY-YIG superfamily endonuclease
MHPAFKNYVENLHPAFDKLVSMPPLHICDGLKGVPEQCIYLFSEGEQYLYVGRTNHFPNRMKQHTANWAQHNQAVFAFRLARELTGKLAASYTPEGSRAALSAETDFSAAFMGAKQRIRAMDLRFVEEPDPLRQSLLEIYVAVALGTRYNDFDTH